MNPKRIKRLRKKLHLTQKLFAELVPCSLDSVRNWEQGQTTPDAMRAKRLKEMEAEAKAAAHGDD